VHLYEAFGFRHVSPGALHMPYERADVFMRLELSPGSPEPGIVYSRGTQGILHV
jgi:predicted N-acetyltransferase YhbS